MKPVKTTNDLTSYLQNKTPGDAVMVTYKHRNIERQTLLTLKEQTAFTIVPFEQSGKTVTDDMKKIRDSWFSTHTK
jgi:PDZ domain-containing secreted protein